MVVCLDGPFAWLLVIMGFLSVFLFSSRPFSFWLGFSRVLQSTNSVTLPEISCHSNHMHFSSCIPKKTPQLNHRARTNRRSIPFQVSLIHFLDVSGNVILPFRWTFMQSEIHYTLETSFVQNSFAKYRTIMLFTVVAYEDERETRM